MESRREIHNRRIKNYEKHLDRIIQSYNYASDRFDILIISLSTTALILSIGFSEEFINRISQHKIICLKIAWIAFTVSLVTNLISQVTGYYSCIEDEKIIKNKIRLERGRKLKGDQKTLEDKAKNLGYATNWLNGASLFALIGGFILVVISLW